MLTALVRDESVSVEVRVGALCAAEELALPIEMAPGAVLLLLDGFMDSPSEPESRARNMTALLDRLARVGDSETVPQLHALARRMKDDRIQKEIEDAAGKIRVRLEGIGVQEGQLSLAAKESAQGDLSLPSGGDGSAGEVSLVRKT